MIIRIFVSYSNFFLCYVVFKAIYRFWHIFFIHIILICSYICIVFILFFILYSYLIVSIVFNIIKYTLKKYIIKFKYWNTQLFIYLFIYLFTFSSYILNLIFLLEIIDDYISKEIYQLFWSDLTKRKDGWPQMFKIIT